MTSLQRSVRQRTFTVVRVRRIKHRLPSATGPRLRREAAPQDLANLIFYGQA